MLNASLQIDSETSHKIRFLAKSKDRSKAQEIRELVNDELRRLDMNKTTTKDTIGHLTSQLTPLEVQN